MIALPYDEEHALLRTEVRRWLAERCPIAEVRRLADDMRGDDPAAWTALAKLGWLGLAIPEAYGGSGLGFTHLAVLCEEAGRHLLPSPLLAATLAALVVERGGSEAQRSRLLPQLANGEVIATLAHVEPSGAWHPADSTVTRSNGRVSGEKRYVWAASIADFVLVPFREPAPSAAPRIAMIDVKAPGVTVVAETGLDRTRRSSRAILRDVAVTDDAILPVDAREIFAYLVPRACTVLAAEMAGGADALLSMTATYAANRIQFGRPIGTFQAIKHPLVNVLINVEHTRSLVYAAAAGLDAADADAELLARMAKAQANDTYAVAASRAVQSHGGFGFTIDCDAHLYFKRAQASRPAFGDTTFHRRWIANQVVGSSSK